MFRSFAGYTLAFTMFLIFTIITVSGDVEGRTITVDVTGTGDHTSVQDAVDAASEGDVLEIMAGTYQETVVVEKRLTLEGSGSSDLRLYGTVDGGGEAGGFASRDRRRGSSPLRARGRALRRTKTNSTRAEEGVEKGYVTGGR